MTAKLLFFWHFYIQHRSRRISSPLFLSNIMMFRGAKLWELAVLLHTFSLAICATNSNGNQACRPSSCGEIRNISNPFRLEGDPSGCGDPGYELVCENNRTMVNLLRDGKYYVAEINYENSTIRVVDPGVKKGNCFSFPLYPFFSDSSASYVVNWDEAINITVLMKCERPISDDSYIPITPCNVTSSSSSSSSLSQPYNYVYALVGGGDSLRVNDLKYSYCTIVSRTIMTQFLKPGNLSMLDLQECLLLGFNLSFLQFRCQSECFVKGLYCSLNYRKNTIECYKCMNNLIFIFIHSCIYF